MLKRHGLIQIDLGKEIKKKAKKAAKKKAKKGLLKKAKDLWDSL